MSEIAERPYEYHLTFWGEAQDCIKRTLDINGTDHWFPTSVARGAFKASVKACADAHNLRVVFSEHEGRDVRLRTVARMIMRLPDGRAFPYVSDFGFAYPVDSAIYMFQDGNYSCDCNRSLFLSQAGHDVPEMDCGETITLEGFTVTQEPAE